MASTLGVVGTGWDRESWSIQVQKLSTIAKHANLFVQPAHLATSRSAHLRIQLLALGLLVDLRTTPEVQKGP